MAKWLWYVAAAVGASGVAFLVYRSTRSNSTPDPGVSAEMRAALAAGAKATRAGAQAAGQARGRGAILNTGLDAGRAADYAAAEYAARAGATATDYARKHFTADYDAVVRAAGNTRQDKPQTGAMAMAAQLATARREADTAARDQAQSSSRNAAVFAALETFTSNGEVALSALANMVRDGDRADKLVRGFALVSAANRAMSINERGYGFWNDGANQLEEFNTSLFTAMIANAKNFLDTLAIPGTYTEHAAGYATTLAAQASQFIDWIERTGNQAAGPLRDLAYPLRPAAAGLRGDIANARRVTGYARERNYFGSLRTMVAKSLDVAALAYRIPANAYKTLPGRS